MPDSSCYVYEHWRPDKNVCFYVGKGSGNRAWHRAQSRNVDYRAVIRQLSEIGLDIEVRIVLEGLTHKEALAKEREIISFYGLRNLTNKAPFNVGSLGHSEATRRKMSETRIGRKLKDHHRAAISEGAKRRGIPQFVREAQRLAVTGKKRAPFTPDTIAKMRIAATEREALKRLLRVAHG